MGKQMPVDIKLPDLGENINEGGVLEIRVKPGDTVNKGDIVVVIEAEKSTVEVPADIAGKVTDILVQKGQTIKPGTVIARIEGNGVAAPAKAPAKAAIAAESKTPTAVAA